jgi:hypothetical protein
MAPLQAGHSSNAFQLFAMLVTRKSELHWGKKAISSRPEQIELKKKFLVPTGIAAPGTGSPVVPRARARGFTSTGLA